MSSYFVISNKEKCCKLAEDLVKKIGGNVLYALYHSNMGRSYRELQYPALCSYENSEITNGPEVVTKLLEIIETRRYLLSWLVLEGKVSLHLVRLINAKL